MLVKSTEIKAMDPTIPTFLNVKIDGKKEIWDKLQKYIDSLWPENTKCIKYPDIVQGRDLNMVIQNDKFIHLGSGVQGDVYVGHHLPTNNFVAVKFFYKDSNTTANIFREGTCLSLASLTCGGPHFYGVVYLSVNEKYQRYATVTEFVGDSSTFECINLKDVILDNNISDKDIIKHILLLLKSLYNLHKVGLVIGDLKFDNCLYDKNSNNWRIIDMGMSVIEGVTVDYMQKYGLTFVEDCHQFLTKYNQVAPETVYYGQLVQKSDVFRIGRILVSTYTKRKGLANILRPIASECLKLIHLRPTLPQVYWYMKSCMDI